MSFRSSFHLPPLGPTGAHWLDDPQNPTCKDSSQQHSWTIRSCLVISRLGFESPGQLPNLTAEATPVWLLGSLAVLSLLYRTPAPAAEAAAGVEDQEPASETSSKRERARAAYAALVAAGQPLTGARLQGCELEPSACGPGVHSRASQKPTCGCAALPEQQCPRRHDRVLAQVKSANSWLRCRPRRRTVMLRK